MQKLISKLTALLVDGELDELVHGVFSGRASDLNNKGGEAQREFLQSCDCTDMEIRQWESRDALDEMVSVFLSDEGSDINNDGVEAQVAFLLNNGYTADTLLKERPEHQVTCGNIGTVYIGRSRKEALDTFLLYVEMSSTGYGRGAYEQVSWCVNGEPEEEYFPDEIQSQS